MRPSRPAVLLLVLLLAVLAVAPSALGTAEPQASKAQASQHPGVRVQELFQRTSRGTAWQLVDRVPLGFDAHHPEGLVRVGDRFVLSTVEVTERTERYPVPRDGTDRTAGKGIGHLIAFDSKGALLQDQRLDDGADIYHPGGLDWDGSRIWVAVAEYRPNRPSIIYSVDPTTLAAREEFRSPDHIGGIVRDTARDRIVGLNWGSRVAYEWKANGRPVRRTLNPSHFVDYQDCKYVGRAGGRGESRMLCGGIATLRHPGVERYDLGGLGLVTLPTQRAAHEVPFQEYSPAGRVGTHNAMWVEAVGDALRLYLVPDDDTADLLVYEARLPVPPAR